VVSLRNPGSFVDGEFPGARVGDGTDPRFFRGSGTSQSAAVISGAAALLLEQRPELSPDQVKRLLVSTADPVSGTDYTASAGQLDVAAAASAPTPSYNSYKQYNQAATGLGSLEASRGSAHVVDTDTGVALTGETDIFGKAWVPSRWAASSASATSWSGGVWNGSLWTGTSFGTVDGVQTWGAGVWTSRTWSGGLWTSRTWSSAVWTDDGWSSRTWSSRTWASRTWASRTWTAAGWPGDTVVPPAAGPSGATWQ
jgi:serine protease AprX